MAEYFKKSYKQEQAALPLSVKNVGYQQCPPGYRWGAGMRDHYLLHYVVSGCGVYTVEGRAYPVSAGQVFLAWPNTVLSYTADERDPWEYYWLGFSGAEAALLLSHTGLQPGRPVMSIGFGRSFQQYVTAIYDARGSGLKNRTQMLGYAYLLLARLLDTGETGGESAGVAARAAEFLDNNYAEQLSSDDIAAAAGVSRSWLYRLFMQEYGVSPAAYLREKRLAHARQLLQSSGLHVAEIARSVGYPDPLYFTKVFTRRFGCTPTAFRGKCVSLSNILDNKVRGGAPAEGSHG